MKKRRTIDINNKLDENLKIDKEIIDKIMDCADIDIGTNVCDIKFIPDWTVGTYIIFNDDNFYIGASENVKKRILTHDVIEFKDIKKIKIYLTDNLDDFLVLESIFINIMIDPKLLNKVIPKIRNVRIIEADSEIKILWIPEGSYYKTLYCTAEEYKYKCDICEFFEIDNIAEEDVKLFESKGIPIIAYKQVKMIYYKTPETIWQTELFVDMDYDYNLDNKNARLLETNFICPICDFYISHFRLYEEFYYNIREGNIVCPNCGSIKRMCEEIIQKE